MADQPVRVGIIGAGAIVSVSHLPAMSKVAGVEAVAIADANEDRRKALASSYGLTEFADYRDLIAGSELDAVLVAVPNNLHRDAIEAAAAAGLHVFTEKPVAHTLVDAQAIGAATTGLVTQVGFNQRFWEPVRIAREGISAGVVGDVEAFRSVYSESYRVYPATTTYRYELERSGGASILDLAIHRIDLARYLVGDIVEVCATVDHRQIPYPADDNVFILVRFESGATGVISADRFSPQVSNATDIYGPVGTIHLSTETRNPFQSSPLAFASELPRERLPDSFASADWPQAWWLDYEPGSWVSVSPPRISPYEQEWAAFVDAIGGASSPERPDIEGGIRAQEVVTAAYRSVRTHGWVSLPLEDPEEPIPTYPNSEH